MRAEPVLEKKIDAVLWFLSEGPGGILGAGKMKWKTKTARESQTRARISEQCGVLGRHHDVGVLVPHRLAETHTGVGGLGPRCLRGRGRVGRMSA